MVDEGQIILIMSQYAHKPDSKTIHSKSQLESFGSLVHDFSVSAGGHQVIVTHEGFVIPLRVRNGLCFMDMKPASDSDLKQYTHVFITSDAPWNPDIVDDEFFFDASDSLLSIPSVQERWDARDPHVNTIGEMYTVDLHSHDHPITQECHSFVVDALSSLSQSIKQCLPDLDTLLPYFGWVGKDRTQTTLEKTSQHYKADQQIPMRKHFRSQFPAANVHLLLEWYSMDTFFSDEPAANDGVPGHGGCAMVHIYGGWTPSFSLATPCHLSHPYLTHSVISSTSMEPWRA